MAEVLYWGDFAPMCLEKYLIATTVGDRGVCYWPGVLLRPLPPYTPPIVLSCPNLTVLPLRHLDLGDKEGGLHRASKLLAMYKGGHFIYIL